MNGENPEGLSLPLWPTLSLHHAVTFHVLPSPQPGMLDLLPAGLSVTKGLASAWLDFRAVMGQGLLLLCPSHTLSKGRVCRGLSYPLSAQREDLQGFSAGAPNIVEWRQATQLCLA